MHAGRTTVPEPTKTAMPKKAMALMATLPVWATPVR